MEPNTADFFQGIPMQLDPDHFDLWVLLVIGLFIVWSLPNTRQSLERLFAVPRSSVFMAGAGFLFACGFLWAMSQFQKVSTFLYYQF